MPAEIQTPARTALITGSAKRIGAFIAQHLHRNGYNVILHYRHSSARAQSLCDSLNQLRPDSCITLQADLNDPISWQALADAVKQQQPRLDVLINNASSFYPTEFGSTTLEQWQDLFASNAQAPFFLTQNLLPMLRASQGCVVNLIDALADHPNERFIPYNMAKSALKVMTLSMAKQLAPLVRVNGIAPGAILWPEHEHLNHTAKQKIIDSIPMGRPGTPLDIAQAILFLIEDAPYITGQILKVDGGRSL